MNRVLCSTGAFIGKANGNDYTLIKEYSSKLNCDGFELMMSSSWYPILDEVISAVNSYKLCIPVVHANKSLGETLTGMRVTFTDGKFDEYVMTPEEDKEEFKRGTEDFAQNLKLAEEIGADKMVLHLWNGLVSDKAIEKNLERFAVWKDMAKKAGICILVENVICNMRDPLYNVALTAAKYDDTCFVYDTKMAEFHAQTMDLFNNEYEWLIKTGKIKHLHINDYSGGYMDWNNMRVLPIGAGHVDFDAFFGKLAAYGYTGDYTVEATALNRNKDVDLDMLNNCFEKLRKLNDEYISKASR